MALLSLLEVSKQYDTKILLKDCNITINENEKIAVIGKNGSGKSTLLQIIEGKIEQDSGNRIISNNIEILALPQKIEFAQESSVEEVLEQSLYNLKSAHNRLTEISHIPNFTDNKALSEEYNQISNYIDKHDGWDMESKIALIMQSFHLESFANRKANSLSGGEQKRIALASLLIKSADILILDEPTNHLDVEMVAFLENYLKKMKASVLFISHDRYFIDNIATRILELDNGKLSNFTGGYLAYLHTKQQMLHNLEKEGALLKKILKSEEKWLQRGVQARRKRNEGRKERLLELRQKVKSLPSLKRSMSETLEKALQNIPKDFVQNTKKMLFELSNFNLFIHDKMLLQNLNLRIMQGERLGIVGKNGSGKSTFLSCLMQATPTDSLVQDKKNHVFHYQGEFKRGEIKIGYFDQHKKMLDDTKTLIETFCPNGGDRINVRGKNIHVYGYLKSFLFPQEELEKKIGFLSGGEKSRVALALLFAQQYDCLILDEPTNDLDIATLNIIEDYLQNSECAIIFVSHDRYFTDKIAQRLLVLHELKTESTQAQNYLITYAKYSELLDIQSELREIQDFKLIENQSPKDSPKPQKQSPKKEDKPKKLSYKEKIEYEALDEEIETLEQKIQLLTSQLSNPSEYEKYGIQTLSKELELTQNMLDYKWQRFEELSLKISE